MPTIDTFIPEEAVIYCRRIIDEYPFEFKLASTRKTKSGDYRFLPDRKVHQISVNKELNRFAFLITFIHEVAHLVAFQDFGRRIRPHGKEWKVTFKKLMLPLLHPGVFPDPILKVLARHMKNPKASSHSDAHLISALRAYNIQNGPDELVLNNLASGTIFTLHGKTYQKLEKKRTRVLCKQIVSNKKYLVSAMALVSLP